MVFLVAEDYFTHKNPHRYFLVLAGMIFTRNWGIESWLLEGHLTYISDTKESPMYERTPFKYFSGEICIHDQVHNN